MTVLSGRRALVTGGSRGIGAAIVQRLAADGARVAFTYAAPPGPADELRSGVSAHGGVAVAIKADSADTHQVIAAVDETVSQLGGLDILVNNAGVAASGTVESFQPARVERMLGINVRAVLTAIPHAIPHLDSGGRIITIGGIFADHVPRPGSAVYAMTKAAVAGLTRGPARTRAARDHRQRDPAGPDRNRCRPGRGRIRRLT
jgi:3-oxoacyl-[acyl-carrier protein] reductase